ncbi:MAG: hypothetical protein FJ381_15160 [Verrucomicrobia bacterium]|nr:hypothetical protein [Verrucomicrobiota bacterium]
MLPLPAFLARHPLCSLPGLMLITLLQRAPAVRPVVAAAENLVIKSPLGQLLRGVFTVAGLGAMHSRAGATTFVRNPAANPLPGNVGAPLQMSFTYTGTPSAPQYFIVTGSLPPGLRFTPALSGGNVIARTPVISGAPTAAGEYTIFVQGVGSGGRGPQEPIRFSVVDSSPPEPPTITRQPESQTVLAGGSVTFTAAASGTPTPTLQWRRDGQTIAGATNATLTVTNVRATDAGVYSVTATNPGGSQLSTAATLTVIAPNANARLTNLSVRTNLAASATLIVGGAVSDGSRDVLFRAIGPTLAAFGVSGTLADPRLELYRGSAKVNENDNWAPALATVFNSVGAFALTNGSRDAALVAPLAPDAFTAQVPGTTGGVVLVEAYDTGPAIGGRLVNVSARNRVGTGDDILIAGFTISGSGNKPLLVRAVGPTLAAFGVGGTLADPKLEIYNAQGVKVTENDTWTAGLATTFASVGAFPLSAGSRDAALLTSLPPGSYTAQIRGSDGGTGEALVELYELR